MKPQQAPEAAKPIRLRRRFPLPGLLLTDLFEPLAADGAGSSFAAALVGHATPPCCFLAPNAGISPPRLTPVAGAGVLVSLAARRKKRRDGDRRGRRGAASVSNPPPAAAAPAAERRSAPAKFPDTRKAWVRIARPPPLSPLDVCAVEISDRAWWSEQGDGDEDKEGRGDAYGARAWPPSLGVAAFLAEYLSAVDFAAHAGDIGRRTPTRQVLLELGCGTGLVSQTAAAAGAAVLATDFSALALDLTRKGWAETSSRLRLATESLGTAELVGGKVGAVGAHQGLPLGTLNCERLDVTSDVPLPLPKRAYGSTPPIVAAAAVLYDRSLASAVARRIFEAVEGWDAWIILGDDDTGLREGGRGILELELDKYEDGGRRDLRRQIVHTTVRNPALGWKDKPVRIMHINAPVGAAVG